MYKCRRCRSCFFEPKRWVETHGFYQGPYEEWSTCPDCDSTDYDEAIVVDREEAALEEADEC